MFEDDGGLLEGASMCATTSILSPVCDAKAFTGVNKAIRNTGTSNKLKYLFSFIFFISDKKCEINYND